MFKTNKRLTQEEIDILIESIRQAEADEQGTTRPLFTPTTHNWAEIFKNVGAME